MPQNKASYDDILSAAAQLFARSGFDGVSLSAIAKQAGTSKANILYHFTSKEALYITVLESCCIEVMDSLHTELSADSRFENRLQGFAENHLAGLLERTDISRLIMRELQDSDSQRGRELAHGVLRNHFNCIVTQMESAQKDGDLRSGIDPAILIAVLLGANQFYFANRDYLRENEKCQGFSDDPKTFTNTLVDILLNGVRNTPSS